MTTAAMLDKVKEALGLATDSDLSDATGIAAPTLCRLRAGKQPLGAAHLVRLHEATDMPTKQLKALAAGKRWPPKKP